MTHRIRRALCAPLLAIAGADCLADGAGGLFGWLAGEETRVTALDDRYVAECGGCHVAYAPWLLDAKDWVRVMASLKDHFGNDVTLAPTLAKDLTTWLTQNAGRDETLSLPARARWGTPLPGGTPRITQTLYFAQRHVEYPPAQVKKHPKVGTYANCQACHPRAEQGRYSEEEVYIPNSDG